MVIFTTIVIELFKTLLKGDIYISGMPLNPLQIFYFTFGLFILVKIYIINNRLKHIY
jgi:hypothetical protein